MCNEKFVIIADVDNHMRIVCADASNWESLPELIDANRCDTMRCRKFRSVAAHLQLPGALLGCLDRDAFRKPDLEPNWRASQWYDGCADLYGDMIICMEDDNFSPLSFSSREQAQSVIEALLQRP